MARRTDGDVAPSFDTLRCLDASLLAEAGVVDVDFPDCRF